MKSAVLEKQSVDSLRLAMELYRRVMHSRGNEMRRLALLRKCTELKCTEKKCTALEEQGEDRQ